MHAMPAMRLGKTFKKVEQRLDPKPFEDVCCVVGAGVAGSSLGEVWFAQAGAAAAIAVDMFNLLVDCRCVATMFKVMH